MVVKVDHIQFPKEEEGDFIFDIYRNRIDMVRFINEPKLCDYVAVRYTDARIFSHGTEIKFVFPTSTYFA